MRKSRPGVRAKHDCRGHAIRRFVLEPVQLLYELFTYVVIGVAKTDCCNSRDKIQRVLGSWRRLYRLL